MSDAANPGFHDPPPTTPFEVIDEHGLLRLRHYAAVGGMPAATPVLLVYSLFKRPYVLDLMPERSIVRSLTSQGFSVYLADWQPPSAKDASRGLDAYVNEDLAHAIECVRKRERVERVALIGCCFGGLLALIYTALYPRNVSHFVPFALSIKLRPQLFPAAIEWLAQIYGNVPAWWIHAGLNARVPSPPEIAGYLARDFGEPELERGPESAVQRALMRWFDSDVPLSGQVFCEVMRDAYWYGQLAENRLNVGGRRVALEDIRCPVLNISAEHDRLVPPESTAPLVALVGSRESRNIVFPTGHLGLMVSLAAHQRLWPGVGLWIRSRVARREHDRSSTPTGPRPLAQVESRPSTSV